MKRTTYLENLLRVSVYENELLRIEKEELIKELNRLREIAQLRRKILCKP